MSVRIPDSVNIPTTKESDIDDILVGLATIKAGPSPSDQTRQGWHLPGGQFTTNKSVAQASAAQLNKWMTTHGQQQH